MRRAANAWMRGVFERLAQQSGTAPALRGHLRWTARRWLRVLGVRGVLGIGLLLVFPPFYFSAIAPAQARLDKARSSAQESSEQAARGGASSEGVRRAPEEQLAQYYRLFPDEKSSPQLLAKLAALAEKNGLSLNEGEYKATRDKTGRLMRLQMALPVKGEYRQIRRFLAALPAAIPVIALENVQFSRQKVADPNVEAQIRLALYMEQAS